MLIRSFMKSSSLTKDTFQLFSNDSVYISFLKVNGSKRKTELFKKKTKIVQKNRIFLKIINCFENIWPPPANKIGNYNYKYSMINDRFIKTTCISLFCIAVNIILDIVIVIMAQAR